MELIGLLNELESLIEGAYYLPLTNLAVIDQAKCLDLLARIRHSLPSELAEAQRLCRVKERILSQVEAEAEEMRRMRQKALADIASAEEMILEAETIAHQTREESERQAREVLNEALTYSSSLYLHIEQDLTRFLEELHSRIPQCLDHAGEGSGASARRDK